MPNEGTNKLNTNLIEAAKQGNLNEVARLLNCGADIHVWQEAPLRAAAASGHTDVVVALLDRGADIHVWQEAPLRAAAASGHTDMVAALLDRGADIHVWQEAPLRDAAASEHTNVVALLLDRGADIHVWQDAPLRDAVQRRHTDMVALLLERGVDIHAHEERALYDAAVSGHTDVAALLLDRGADVHANAEGPLYEAVVRGHTDMVALLLDRGADVHASGEGPLYEAVARGYTDVAELLLDRGAIVDARAEGPFYQAIERGRTDLVALLLNHGADIHAHDDAALRGAVASGDTDMVSLLLNRGADIHAWREEPLRAAAARGQANVVALLLDKGAHIHAHEEAALREAAARGHANVVALLLDRGADIRAAGDFLIRGRTRRASGVGALWDQADELAVLATTLPRRYVYGAAAVAASLGLSGKALVTFVEQTAETETARTRRPPDTLGLRPFAEAKDLGDMGAETAEAILLPQLLLDAGLAGRDEIAEIPPAELDRWLVTLKPLAARVLLHGHDLSEILALGREWHVPGNALPDRLRPLRGGTWHALLPQLETPILTRSGEGEEVRELPVTVKALTSQTELEEEGDQLKHCVGTSDYGTACRQGKIHILSFRSGDRPLATMEVTLTGKSEQPLACEQFRGANNKPPPNEAALAWIWLQEQLKRKSPLLNPKPETGWGEIPTERLPAPAVQIIGYWPSEERVYRCYRHLAERLKIKQPTVREARRPGAFWTPATPESGYRWRSGLIAIREGFDGVMKDEYERSGLHQVIEAAGVRSEWNALVHDAREQWNRRTPHAGRCR